MKNEKIEKLLHDLAEYSEESVPPQLASRIKQNIPSAVVHHKGPLDNINIIIDLRVSKLAAAAAIILTMILCANFLGSKNTTGEGIYQNSKMLIKAYLGFEDETAHTGQFYESLVSKGKEPVYYGDAVNTEDANAIIIHWKVSEDKYKIIFTDFREKEVTADELIRLQAQMLQNSNK
ncbi:hypothetical protein ACFL3G_11465 [Planctomycetota bacterium]